MITSIKIENYKSVQNSELELGRFNVLIGENGCGKSNILEAFAFASAAIDNKLHNEYFVSRGIRMVKPELMRSAFLSENISKNIRIQLNTDDENVKYDCDLAHSNILFEKWVNSKSLSKTKTRIEFLNRISNNFKNELSEEDIIKLNIYFLDSFLIYAPENSSLRTFEKEGQIEPLGIRGEGLFKLLKTFSKDELQLLNENLKLIDWFNDFELPQNTLSNEFYLSIKDKYIDESIKGFDQKSSNEGFLYLLFYLSLFISNKTPQFFAIDNIENALNPKLCTELIKVLVQLSAKMNKQVILTTHNPAVLDGLDLSDPQHRLFAVRRNKLGHTINTRVEPKHSGNIDMKLSEAWMRGYLGALPKNF